MIEPRDGARKIAFQTLGCRLNQYETDSLASQFLRAGYRVVPATEPADAYVINTCTVTNKSDRKSRNAINRALRSALPGDDATREQALVVATGCFVDSHREELEASGLNFAVGNAHKASIFELVDAHFRGEIWHPSATPDTAARNPFGFAATERVFHTRSMIKIQDGCDNFCSFCIIPQVRGRAISRPADEILENVRETVGRGSREIVITGVNISRYRDGETNFSSLLEKILALPEQFRMRISSMEPDSLDDRFFDLIDHPKMCPHLHLCLQSASERILLQMRRQYTYRQYRSIVDRIRRDHPDFNLTTDVIVGFPGETDDDFATTCDAIRSIGFSHVHTFPYSRRSGTRAERTGDQLPERVKKSRSEAIRAIAEAGKRAYRAGFVGRSQDVLVEKVRHGDRASGYGEHYLPVEFVLPEVRENAYYPVLLRDLAEGDDPVLFGSAIAQPGRSGSTRARNPVHADPQGSSATERFGTRAATS